ncbi:MAG TPA: hypothetical protein VGG01_10625 [Xanthobacteraceae bacterium]|jgi:hypothetical protein
MIDLPLRRIALSFPLVVAATLSAWAAPKARVERFDGPWSVVIVTDQGTCDRAYRYGLRIEAGRVLYAGGSDVRISGQVDAKGRVSVEVRSGDSSARGNGRLSDSGGEGRWEGRSQNATCSGHWQAERGGSG